MSPTSASSARVSQDTHLFLKTIRDEIEDGRRPYASDIRRVIERSLALRFAEYLQFLEKYGFVTFDRRADLLALTRAGDEVVDGHEGRIRGLLGDASYYFGDRLKDLKEERPVAAAGKRLDKRYLQLDKIGNGGLGTVWRGAQLSVDRPVALKMLDGLFDLFPVDQHEEILRRLEIAVREHARLINPFIVQILDQNPQHDTPYYVMELAEGGNLREALNDGPLPAAVAVRYFLQIALALKAAHDEGVLHRDLRPENVLLDKIGNVKVSDFGITRVVERDGANVRQAYIGYGSVGYMAPENFRRGAVKGPGTDIYALGILLYEMLVGELPGRRSPMPSEVSEGVPPDIDELFDRMTQDDPKRRPTQIGEVLEFVWQSKDIIRLLDARQAPLFIEAPMPLPGLKIEGGAPSADQTEKPAAFDAPEPEPGEVGAAEPAARPASRAPARAEEPRRAPIARRSVSTMGEISGEPERPSRATSGAAARPATREEPAPRGRLTREPSYEAPVAQPVYDPPASQPIYEAPAEPQVSPIEEPVYEAPAEPADDFSRTLQRLSVEDADYDSPEPTLAAMEEAWQEPQADPGRRAPVSRGRGTPAPAPRGRGRFDSNPSEDEARRAPRRRLDSTASHDEARGLRPRSERPRPASGSLSSGYGRRSAADDVVPSPVAFPEDGEVVDDVEMIDVDDVLDQGESQDDVRKQIDARMERFRRR